MSLEILESSISNLGNTAKNIAVKTGKIIKGLVKIPYSIIVSSSEEIDKLNKEYEQDIEKLYSKIINEDYYGRFNNEEVQRLARAEATREAEILLIEKKIRKGEYSLDYEIPSDSFSQTFLLRDKAKEIWYREKAQEIVNNSNSSIASLDPLKEIKTAVTHMYNEKAKLVKKIGDEVKSTRKAKQRKAFKDKTEKILKDINNKSDKNQAELILNVEEQRQSEENLK